MHALVVFFGPMLITLIDDDVDTAITWPVSVNHYSKQQIPSKALYPITFMSVAETWRSVRVRKIN
jgi:hypothetical protein